MPAKRLHPVVRLPAAVERRLAVEADVDPRTLRAVAAGEPVTTMARERALLALLEAGYLPPDPSTPKAA